MSVEAISPVPVLPVLPPVASEPGGHQGRVQTVEYTAAQVGEALFGKDGPSFKDLLAAINPLQHIPVVGTIYRYLTGDTLSPGARLAGGMLYGGPIGLLGACINAAVEGGTGKDIGDHVLAMAVQPQDKPADVPATMLASAEVPLPVPKPPLTEATAAPTIGPPVTANPVTPVARNAIAPIGGSAGDTLTPEAYARAIAAAHGHAAPPLPVRAAQPGAQTSGPVELSNEDFVRLLAAFGQGNAAAETPAQVQPPPAQPAPITVPVAGAEYRSSRSPSIIRAPGRFTPQMYR